MPRFVFVDSTGQNHIFDSKDATRFKRVVHDGRRVDIWEFSPTLYRLPPDPEAGEGIGRWILQDPIGEFRELDLSSAAGWFGASRHYFEIPQSRGSLPVGQTLPHNFRFEPPEILSLELRRASQLKRPKVGSKRQKSSCRSIPAESPEPSEGCALGEAENGNDSLTVGQGEAEEKKTGMPTDPRMVVRAIFWGLEKYLNGMSNLDDPEQFRATTFQIEAALAESGYSLLRGLDEFERLPPEHRAGISTSVRRDIQALRTIIGAQWDRWGWAEIKTIDGMSILVQRLRDHDLIRRSAYAALITSRDRADTERNPYLDDQADRARAEGIEADRDIDPSQALAIAEERYDRYAREPILSDRSPSPTREERNQLEEIKDGLEKYCRAFVRELNEKHFAERAERGRAQFEEAERQPITLPESAPIPQGMEELDEPLRQRAKDAWRASSKLFRLLDCWTAWGLDLWHKGYADPGAVVRLEGATATCLQALHRLGADVPTLMGATPSELLGRLPGANRSGQRDWYRDADFREETRVRTSKLASLQGELWRLMQVLKDMPSAAFVENPPDRRTGGSRTHGPQFGIPPVTEPPAEKDNDSEAGVGCGLPSTEPPARGRRGDEEVTLTPNQRDILVAMNRLSAFDSDRRQTADKIARAAGVGGCVAEDIKKALKSLKKSKIIDSTRGRGGGYWLTETGRKRAEKIGSKN